MSTIMQAHRERVGRQIKKARLSAGLSHDKLAAAIGTSRQHLIRLEKGHHLPRPEMLAAIARETGKPESFLESEDEEESSSMPLHRDADAARDMLEQLHAAIGIALGKVPA